MTDQELVQFLLLFDPFQRDHSEMEIERETFKQLKWLGDDHDLIILGVDRKKENIK